MIQIMKLSFTTAGCPGWTFDEIFAVAKDLGIQGIEIRGLGDVIFAPDISIFAPDEIENTKKRMADAKMEFPVLDSTAALGVADVAQAAMIEAKAYIDLAAKLGTSYIRVMVSPKAEPTHADLELCEKQYRELCDYGAAKNVSPLMETNGVFGDSKLLAKFMQKVNHAGGGVLWDIHHPYRFFGETPEQTVQNIGKYIRHTHIKDSVMADGAIVYRMMGYGDVPITDAVAALKKIDYEGYISLEWLKRYNPYLQEPGIVFAHFASFMSYIFEEA